MTASFRWMVWPVLACGAVACAASGGAGGAQPATYKTSLGTTPIATFARQVPRILNLHQYQIERQDSSTALMTIYTRWKERFPLQDEAESGVTEARTRFTVTARARSRTGGTADVRVVELMAENMVLRGDTLAWHSGVMTPMFREYVDRLAEELKTELLTGLRVY